MVVARCSALRLCLKLYAILVLDGVKVSSISCTAGWLVQTESKGQKLEHYHQPEDILQTNSLTRKTNKRQHRQQKTNDRKLWPT